MSARTLFPVAVVLLVLFALPGAVVFAADLLGYGANVNGFLERTLSVSHRLAVSVPAAVTLFFVPPVIVLLYFLRLKRKPVAVSSTFLWHKSIEDLHVNRLMQWIRQNILLLLQLLAVLFLIYAALGPRLHGTVSGGRHYILIVDNSASMSATDVPPNRLAWAKAEALKEIDAATDSDSGMVIVFNRTAEIRQSYTTNRAVLRAAVEGIQPTTAQTRIDEALSLAASLANPLRSTENEVAAPDAAEPGKERQYVAIEGMQADVHLYSDGVFPPVPGFSLTNLNLIYHTPPAPKPAAEGTSNNLAIVRLDAVRGWNADPGPDRPNLTDADRDDPTKLTVTASVRNYRAVPAEGVVVRLDVLAGGEQLLNSYSKKLTLYPKGGQPSAGQEVSFLLADVPETADVVLRVRIENAADALPLDDTASLVPGVTRKARVLVMGAENRILRDFFDSPSTQKIADVVRYGPDRLADRAAYLDPARDGKYDLVIFDRCAPPTEDEMPRANTLFLGVPPPPWKVPVAGTPPDAQTVTPVNNPPVRGWSESHPATRRLRGLYEVEISDAYRFPELPPKTARLIESDGNLVLLAAFPRGSFTDLALTFPIVTDDGRWNTLWPLRPSFILFLRNVLRSMGNVRDALADDVLRPGDIKALRPGAATKVRVTAPDGRTDDLDRGSRAEVQFADTNQLGVYAAEWSHDGKDDRVRFAVNLFDAEESDLAPRGAVSVGSQTVAADEGRKPPRDLWKWAVLAGLLVLLTEWWVYNKRVQI